MTLRCRRPCCDRERQLPWLLNRRTPYTHGGLDLDKCLVKYNGRHELMKIQRQRSVKTRQTDRRLHLDKCLVKRNVSRNPIASKSTSTILNPSCSILPYPLARPSRLNSSSRPGSLASPLRDVTSLDPSSPRDLYRHTEMSHHDHALRRWNSHPRISSSGSHAPFADTRANERFRYCQMEYLSDERPLCKNCSCSLWY